MKGIGDFNSSIRSALGHYKAMALLSDVGPLQTLNASNAFLTASRLDPPYSELFEIGSGNRDYNFSLTDGSFFQFAMWSNKRQCEFRYAFYPNPRRRPTLDEFRTR